MAAPRWASLDRSCDQTDGTLDDFTVTCLGVASGGFAPDVNFTCNGLCYQGRTLGPVKMAKTIQGHTRHVDPTDRRLCSQPPPQTE